MTMDVSVILLNILFGILILNPEHAECNFLMTGFSSLMTFLGKTKTYMAGETICQYTCDDGEDLLIIIIIIIIIIFV